MHLLLINDALMQKTNKAAGDRRETITLFLLQMMKSRNCFPSRYCKDLQFLFTVLQCEFVLNFSILYLINKCFTPCLGQKVINQIDMNILSRLSLRLLYNDKEYNLLFKTTHLRTQIFLDEPQHKCLMLYVTQVCSIVTHSCPTVSLPGS